MSLAENNFQEIRETVFGAYKNEDPIIEKFRNFARTLSNDPKSGMRTRPDASNQPDKGTERRTSTKRDKHVRILITCILHVRQTLYSQVSTAI